jgi:uncharacterized protein YqeY
MSLPDRVQADLKQAMMDKDVAARDALRMLKTDLTRREIELGRALEDAEAIDVVQRAVKQRRESIESFEAGGRKEAADKERREIEVLERYLPKQLDEAEVRAAAAAIAAELGLAGKKDLGRLMKELMARHRGTLDGKLASRIAGEVLG